MRVEHLTDDELDFEATRIGQRLTFLETLGRLWKIASAASGAVANRTARDERLLSWSGAGFGPIGKVC